MALEGVDDMVVTVECPFCGEVIEVPEYNTITRSDALIGHIATHHVSRIMPSPPKKGPPLPKGLKIKWPWRK